MHIDQNADKLQTVLPTAVRAQVFIATTTGLVQILSITTSTSDQASNQANNKDEFSNVVTIAGTSLKAGISDAYNAFVEKPQGIIGNVFGARRYRVNLSSGIDQGESWQLGFFIAHYLCRHDCLSSAPNTAPTIARDAEGGDDVIFIATGRINTLTNLVLPIDALAKKCVLAEANIRRWLAQRKKVYFLAPSENFREPVPNTILKLTPISHLRELYHLCQLCNLSVAQLNISSQIDSQPLIIEHNSNLVIQAQPLSDSDKGDSKNSTSFSAEQAPRKTILSRLSCKAPIILALVVLGLLITLTTLLVSDNNIFTRAKLNNSDSSGQGLVFALVGKLSENRGNCLQGGSSVLDSGVLDGNTRANTSNLKHICELNLVTTTQVSSIWLVSETGAILSLNAKSIANATLSDIVNVNEYVFDNVNALQQWTVPLPTNRSQTRSYTLLIFSKPSDVADMSSLDSFLYQLNRAGHSHNINDLNTWISNTQSMNTVFTLGHELSIQK